MKKNIISLLFTIFSATFVFAELPKIENNAESVVYAFQYLVDNLYSTGTSLNVDCNNKEFEIKTYSDQLKLNYENVRRYVEAISQGKKIVESSGILSKTEISEFKNTMENNFGIQQKDVDWCKLPPSVKPIYKNPNIAILESNAKIHEENIAQAQKLLNEMQSPSEIQETITKEHEELEQLKTAKKKDSARISELENHAVELGLAYGQALSNERQFKKIIADNTAKLKAIPTQIQQFKDLEDAEYKSDFMKQIANINTWIDFFEGKNTVIYDFMQMLDAKTAMQKKLDDVVPLKDARIYQLRLNEFLESWRL